MGNWYDNPFSNILTHFKVICTCKHSTCFVDDTNPLSNLFKPLTSSSGEKSFLTRYLVMQQLGGYTEPCKSIGIAKLIMTGEGKEAPDYAYLEFVGEEEHLKYGFIPDKDLQG